MLIFLRDTIVKLMSRSARGKGKKIPLQVYIYKGHDRCVVYIESGDGEKIINEIQIFQDARWVSPPEAVWRIYEFSLNEMQPPVINLQLHLPDNQAGTKIN